MKINSLDNLNYCCSAQIRKAVQFIFALIVFCGATSSFAAPRVAEKFSLEIDGFITIEAESHAQILNKKASIISFQPIHGAAITSFHHEQLDENVTDGETCFDELLETDIGQIHIKKEKDGTGTVMIWFEAKVNDESDIETRYVLELYMGSVWQGEFPPAESESSFSYNNWILTTDAKGKYRNSACRGMGVDTGTVSILN